jgi:hypothetical protein
MLTCISASDGVCINVVQVLKPLMTEIKIMSFGSGEDAAKVALRFT